MTRLHHLGIAASLLAAFAVGFSFSAPAAVFGADTTSWPRIVRVPIGGDLQAVLDAVRPGDFIELPAGATFVGNFTLPNKVGSGWVVIYTSAFWRLPPPGTRISPADASLMPKLVTPNQDPAIRTAAGAHHYTFVGIEITTTSSPVVNLVKLETPEQAEQTVQQLPTDITLYRCYIHGTPTGEIRRGVALNGARLAVMGSYLADFHERDGDSQAIMGWKGPGPFTIVGNYLEAAGVNVMFGGGDPTIPNLVPADIQIRGNRFFKPLSWRIRDPAYAGIPWKVKNFLEFKNAQRVLVDGNSFENNWVQADQDGFAIVFTPRNQDGACNWCVVEDITFTHNIVRHSTGGAYILGWDNFLPSGQTRRIMIRDNLFVDIGAFPSALPDSGVLFLIADGPADLVIDHNTMMESAYPIYALVQIVGRWPATGFVFTNDITRVNQGVAGDGTLGKPLLTLSTYFPGSLFTNNVLVGGDPAQYPPGNFIPATLDAVGFVDYAGGDYRLADSSPYRHAGTDGEDIGADIRTLMQIMDWWGLPVNP